MNRALLVITLCLCLPVVGQTPKLRQRCKSLCVVTVDGVGKGLLGNPRRYRLAAFYPPAGTAGSLQVILRLGLAERVRRYDAFDAAIYVAADSLPETERASSAKLVEMDAESYGIEAPLTKEELQRIAAAKQSATITIDGIALTIQGDDIAAWRTLLENLPKS